jgi:hypothetical protein
MPASEIHLRPAIRSAFLRSAFCAFFALNLCTGYTADTDAAKVIRLKEIGVEGELDQDFPFVSACIGASTPPGNKAYKGIAIKLSTNAYVCFDTDLLRMSAGWTGKFLNFNGVAFDGSHGGHPTIAGDLKFTTEKLPGVAGSNGEFKDARPEPFGPVSEDLARWNGLYLQGNDVILSYTALGTKILELPSIVEENAQLGFVRDFRIEKVVRPFSLVICDTPNGAGKIDNGQAMVDEGGDGLTRVALVDAPKGVRLAVQNYKKVVLSFDKGTPASNFRLVLWTGKKGEAYKFGELLADKPATIDIKQAGPARWPELVTTKGVLNFSASPDGAYAVDQLTPPAENPWKRRVRFGGFDFFSDGKRAAVCTWDGDVWIVSGIDDKLEKLEWKRFASGGYETLGLKIVDDVIYTSGRDQITRYYDFNQDGECDFYENFNNHVTSSEGFHEFLFDLHTDAEGNFYMVKAGPVRQGGSGFGGDGFGSITAHAGTLMKVSKDGKNLEVVATGLRAPNGMGVGPNGELTTGDNEGTWVPACPLNWLEPGGFAGVEALAHKNPMPQFKPPLCWMSHNDMDNSGGGQIWVTTDKWGPFQGELLHMSYGKCTLNLVLKEKVGDQWQGGVVKFPLKFTSSAMRARVHPTDGQIYVAGLQGWQTSAVKLAGLDRIRYTGKPVYTVNGLKVKKGAVELSFTQPLDPAYGNDAENFSVKRWNYNRGDHYGSPEYSLLDPKKEGRDDVSVESATLSPDGRTVTLAISDLKPVMQQAINFDLRAKDGTEIRQYIQHTIHVIP